MTDQFPPRRVMERVYKDIAKRHKQMAKLPIEEKIRCLVSMQRNYNGFNKKKEKKWRVWEI